jgi:16S rRNA (cytosine967-C5)-methyltransferase
VEDVPLVRESIRITGSTALAELGAHRQGLFFVQDPGATLVTQYAAIPLRSLVADLCAAPGGKTLELSRLAHTVLAFDRSLPRLRRLVENVRRVDARNVFACVADARFPAIGRVDVVLLDAPCTGTGTLRRHPDARWRLKVSDLAVMAAMQRALLRSGAEVVRPGGLLIYATCSLEPEENDRQVESFLRERPEWQLEPPPDGAVPAAVLDGGLLRVLPQRHGVDGAFAARLRRTLG